MQVRQVTCSTILIGPILHCRRDYHPSEKCHVSAVSEGREGGRPRRLSATKKRLRERREGSQATASPRERLLNFMEQ